MLFQVKNSSKVTVMSYMIDTVPFSNGDIRPTPTSHTIASDPAMTLCNAFSTFITNKFYTSTKMAPLCFTLLGLHVGLHKS